MTSVDLSIIIVNWNSKDYVQNCIASILANTFGIDYEIIVVDSASFDGCGDMLQCLYPQVRFIQSERNVGFGRANNLGVKYTCGNVLLLLNPDTEVRDHAIKCLYTHLSKLPRAGVVGCRLLNTDGSLQSTCVQRFPTIVNQVVNAQIFQRWFPRVGLWMTAATFEGVASPPSVEVVSGACMMITRDVFNTVGGFSTDYFMYAEDLDLCYKICAAGFTNYYVPEVEIVHHGGGSTQHRHSRFSNVMMRESVSRLLKKTHGNLYSLGYRIALSGSAVVRLALLTLFFPASLIRHGTHGWGAALDKWVAILRWGLGLENWVQEYDNTEEVDVGVDYGKENQ